MSLTAPTLNALTIGTVSAAAASEIDAAITAAGVVVPGALTVTNAMIADGGMQSASPLATRALGYATGAGAAVTQATNRTTAVTCSAVSGAITTSSASLAAEAAAAFTVTNTAVAIGDVVVVSQRSGSNGGNTDVYVSTVAAGSFAITVANNNAAAGTAETGAIIINFAVVKAVSA